MEVKNFYIVFLFVFCAACSKQSKPVSTDRVQKNDGQKETMRPFSEVIAEINTLELPHTFWCGGEFYKWASDYGQEVQAIAPKGAAVIGKLPAKDDKEYVIFGEVGDIIYPYMYTYNDDGQLLDSLYLHIGACVGDEEVIISNATTIKEDYTVSMVDTTKYIHYDEDYITEFLDSIAITYRIMALGDDGLYTLATQEE